MHRIKEYLRAIRLIFLEAKHPVHTLAYLKFKHPPYEIALKTGGRLLKIKDLIKEDTFMMTYGDGVADINLKNL